MTSHGAKPSVGGHGRGFDDSRVHGDANANHAPFLPLGKTRRERLSELLFSSEEGVSLEQIEKILEVRRQTALSDLEHLRLSFRHRQATLLMVPPSCDACGYTFRLESPRAPSKCPSCKSRDLTEPIFKAAALA